MIKTEINTDDLKAVLRTLPPVLKAETADALDYVSKKFLKEFRLKRLSGRPGIIARPHGIFQQFQRIFTLPNSREGLGVVIFTESKIAKLHETGGTVRAGAGGKIAVPLSSKEELFTSSGSLRQKYRTREGRKNLVPIKFGTQTFLTRILKRTREVRPLFVLKGEVRLPARLGFYETWDEMQPTIFQILAQRVIRAVKKEWSEGEVRIHI